MAELDDDTQALLAWLGERQPMTPHKRRRFFIDRSDGFRFWSRLFRFGHSEKFNDWWVSIGRKGRSHIYYRKANNGSAS